MKSDDMYRVKNQRQAFRQWIRATALLLFCIFLAGCEQMKGYMGFWKQQRQMQDAFEQNPNADIVRWLNPDDCFMMIGRFTIDKNHQNDPILVMAVTDQFQNREIVTRRILQPSREYYQAYLPEGDYDIYFFRDIDKNGYFETDELIKRTSGSPVKIRKTAVKDGLVFDGPAFILDSNEQTAADISVNIPVKLRNYLYTSLDDPFFDPEYGQKGLYDSKAFLTHTQGYMFAMEKFDSRKTLIIFVHGVGGTPRDFKYLVEGLDRTKYQPWFFYYPSGMPLQKQGACLASILKYANTIPEFRLQRVIIVAHSMGGLVSLCAINELCSNSAPDYLKGYISFNSPYGGNESVKSGLKNAPAIIPVWHDIVAGSPFLETLYQGTGAGQIPFYLFFGYKTGESSDGTIDLQSQLDHRVHLKAFKSFGFNTTHIGILNDESSQRLFYQVLSDISSNASN